MEDENIDDETKAHSSEKSDGGWSSDDENEEDGKAWKKRMDLKDKTKSQKDEEEKIEDLKEKKEVANYRMFSRVKHADHKFKVLVNDKQVIEIVKNDIVLEQVDAIVNHTNRFLMHHSGMAADLVERGGQSV